MKKYLISLTLPILLVGCTNQKSADTKAEKTNDQLLLELIDERFEIAETKEQRPEVRAQIKLLLVKEMLAGDYSSNYPDQYLKILQDVVDKENPLAIFPKGSTKPILNLSDKSCDWSQDIDYAIKQAELSEYCFSKENIAYFSSVDVAEFSVRLISSLDDFKKFQVDDEFKARIKDRIKEPAVAQFLLDNKKT